METIRIGEVCNILNGFAFKSDNYVESGIRVIRIANVQKGYIEDSAPAFYPIDSDGLDKYMLESGDLLMSLTGNVGRVAILADEFLPAALNQRVACLRIKDDRISKRYLFHILNSDFFEQKCIQSSKGVAQKNMSTEWLKEYEIPLYSESEQAEIVSVLDRIRGIISSREQELKKLDELIKARFVEMFGTPFDTTRWSVKKLKELSESMVDGSNVNPDYYESTGEVLFLRIQNVWRNEFRLDDSVYIPSEINKTRYYDTSLKKGDLLITKIGRYYTKDSSLGRVSVYLGEDDCANYSNNIMRVRLKDTMNSEFINVLLNLDEYQSFIKRTSKGGTDKRALSKSLIGSYPIIIPPKALQDDFVSFVKQIDKSKVAVQKSLDETQLLFDSLMQEYFE